MNKGKRTKANKYEMDMCNGPLFPKILVFTIPVMLSGILQLLFNAADIIVVGRYAGSDALAAVGSTSSLINLLTNLFIGLSVGANVLVARYYGSGQKKELSDMVHTAVLTALISGCILVVVGVLVARPILFAMGTPDGVLDQSVLYIRIYFVGMPSVMAYNFGSAILRAVGDTKRPLYFLSIAGVANVIMNLFFVIIVNMGVAGVALATVLSQTISASLVIRCLVLSDGDYKLVLTKLRISKDKLIKMLQIGLPAGLQGTLFSISNVLIQSSVNSFGAVAMAGNAAAANIEGFVYIAMNSLYQTSISFTGQNYGAKKFKRIFRILLICQGLVLSVGLVMGNAVHYYGDILLRLYTSEEDVIAYGQGRMAIVCVFYCFCGMMDVAVGVLRGMGYSIMPMLVSLSGACLFRIVWIYTVFRKNHTLRCLYLSYPISWALTFTTLIICFSIVYRKAIKTA